MKDEQLDAVMERAARIELLDAERGFSPYVEQPTEGAPLPEIKTFSDAEIREGIAAYNKENPDKPFDFGLLQAATDYAFEHDLINAAKAAWLQKTEGRYFGFDPRHLDGRKAAFTGGATLQ